MAVKRRIPVRRRILDALIAATSIAVLWLIIVSIDGHAGDQVARFVKTNLSENGGLAAQLHHGVAHATRSAWELSHVYGPLMTFTGIALVLVLVMMRAK